MFPFEQEHNHRHCIKQALEQAASICQERGLRLTPIRSLVLKLIWQNHQALGAYELLPALAEAGFNSAPPTVYRALDFLQEQGLIHRIALLNAFVGCPDPCHSQPSSFLICQHCHLCLELPNAKALEELNKQAQNLGFKTEQQAIEVLGSCAACQQEQVQ